MGTVHAKSEQKDIGEVGGGLFEFEEPMEMEEEPIPKPTIQLGGVRARVDRVHVDGLNRTKDDIIRSTVDELFHATDFEDVILKAHKVVQSHSATRVFMNVAKDGTNAAILTNVIFDNYDKFFSAPTHVLIEPCRTVRRALDSMGCFREIGVYIDVSSGPGATPEGLEVTFQVRELSRIVGGVNTTVSENEGNLVLGVKLPNVLGRGEKVQAEYSMGYRSSSNFSVMAAKPWPHRPLTPDLSATVYQQNHEYPWSGYRLLDRGLLLDLAFRTSPATKHNLQWEGLVRDTSVLSKTTSFAVRENSGPQMKSVIRHIVSVDHRDEPIFPTRGTFVQFTSEVAGLGGGVAHLKTELNAQANVAVTDSVVLQVSGALGVLHDMFGTSLPDRLFLGGATSLRGFSQRGVGPHCDGQARGGQMYWMSGLHVYTPLPFQPARGGLGALFRSHLFVNAGCLTDDEEKSKSSTLEALSLARFSCGAGVALRLGRAARLELNYCVPLKARPGDRPAPGLQFGVGAHFL